MKYEIIIRNLILTLLCLLVISCGGGGDNGGIDGTGFDIKGTAAIGAPIKNATVFIKDKNGTRSQTTTDINGKFNISFSTSDAPYLLQTSTTDNKKLYSIAYTSGVTNIHTLTDLVVRNQFSSQGKNIDTAFDADQPLSDLPTVENNTEITNTVNQLMAPAYDQLDVPQDFNLFTTEFDANSTQFDKLLDIMDITYQQDKVSVKLIEPVTQLQSTVTEGFDLNANLAAPDNQIPTKPTNISAIAASDKRIVISWQSATDNIGIAGYKIYKDDNTALLSTTAFTTFTDESLSPSTNHCYLLAAFDANGNESLKTLPACATTLEAKDETAPDAVSSLNVVAQSDSIIKLSWNAVDNIDVVGYRIKRGKTPETTTTFAVLQDNYVDTELEKETEYCYTVEAFDAANNTSTPTEQICTTTLSAADTVAPSSIDAVTSYTNTNSKIKLSWEPAQDNDVTHYKVYKVTDNETTLVATVNEPELIIEGLEAATQYCYQLSSVDSSGNESEQNTNTCETTIATPDTTAPEAATGLSVSKDVDNIQLSWAASNIDDLKGYYVYLIIGDTYQSLGYVTEPSFSYHGIENNQTYCYSIRTSDISDNISEYSTNICIEPLPSPSIETFEAQPEILRIGESTRLFAEFSNGEGVIDQGVGEIASGGDISVSPTENTTYTLTVTNADGDSIAQSETVVVKTEEDIIAETLADCIQAYNKQDLEKFMACHSLNYLDDGEDYNVLRQRMADRISDPDFQPIDSHTLLSTSIEGINATTEAIFEIGSIDDPNTDVWRMENGEWKIFGNQQWYAINPAVVNLGTVFTETPKVNIWLSVDDNAGRATSVTVTGPGIETLPLELTRKYISENDTYEWSHEGETTREIKIMDNSIPLPWTYTVTIIDSDGTHTYEEVVTNYIQEFSNFDMPKNVLCNDMLFNWNTFTTAESHRIKLLDTSSGETLWRKTTPLTSIQYDGPTLDAQLYRKQLVSGFNEENKGFASITAGEVTCWDEPMPAFVDISGTITFPASITDKTYLIAIDEDHNGENGFKRIVEGQVTGNSISYEFLDAPVGEYFIYTVVKKEGPMGAVESGDFMGAAGFVPAANKPYSPTKVTIDENNLLFDFGLLEIPTTDPTGQWEADCTPIDNGNSYTQRTVFSGSSLTIFRTEYWGEICEANGKFVEFEFQTIYKIGNKINSTNDTLVDEFDVEYMEFPYTTINYQNVADFYNDNDVCGRNDWEVGKRLQCLNNDIGVGPGVVDSSVIYIDEVLTVDVMYWGVGGGGIPGDRNINLGGVVFSKN